MFKPENMIKIIYVTCQYIYIWIILISIKAATYYDASKNRFLSPETCLEYGLDELREIGLPEVIIDGSLKTTCKPLLMAH